MITFVLAVSEGRSLSLGSWYQTHGQCKVSLYISENGPSSIVSNVCNSEGMPTVDVQPCFPGWSNWGPRVGVPSLRRRFGSVLISCCRFLCTPGWFAVHTRGLAVSGPDNITNCQRTSHPVPSRTRPEPNWLNRCVALKSSVTRKRRCISRF